MEEILLAVKNRDIDEESALDILVEFIDKSKITKVKNIIKLLCIGTLSLENASKMLNAMSSLNNEDLNHSSIATTQKYIRRTQQEINKVSSSIDFTYSW